MSQAASSPITWSQWHNRLHKQLLANPDLLPKGASLLLSISGGQDSMVLLQLIMDLQRIYKWNLQVWHGDHRWHPKSPQIATELGDWCKTKRLSFYCDCAKINQKKNEANARDWRYKNLMKKASELTRINPSTPCNHVLTGHTGSDRAETLLMNIARGADLAGLSSLRECRVLQGDVKLVRPLLSFSRKETAQLCKKFNLPIWIDPSNANHKFSRNRIREEVIPVLEALHPGSSLRMASLAERLNHYKSNQDDLAIFAINVIRSQEGLCRLSLSKLSSKSRAILLAKWLREEGAPNLTAAQIEMLSRKIGPKQPPGSLNLAKGWQVHWIKNLVKLIQTN